MQAVDNVAALVVGTTLMVMYLYRRLMPATWWTVRPSAVALNVMMFALCTQGIDAALTQPVVGWEWAGLATAALYMHASRHEWPGGQPAPELQSRPVPLDKSVAREPARHL